MCWWYKTFKAAKEVFSLNVRLIESTPRSKHTQQHFESSLHSSVVPRITTNSVETYKTMMIPFVLIEYYADKIIKFIKKQEFTHTPENWEKQ